MMNPLLFPLLLAGTLVSAHVPPPQPASAPQETFRKEELRLTAGGFSLTGDLYLPLKGGKHPLLILVPGDGPFTRAQGLAQLKMMGVFDALMVEGFAVFIDDKPGFGASAGTFTEGKLFHERAMILSAWIRQLKTHHAVNPRASGSQVPVRRAT